MDFTKSTELIRNAQLIAITNYKTHADYEHACRVAEYVDGNSMIADYEKEPCIALALLHDLLEDTDLDVSNLDLQEDMLKALCLLTRPAHLSYPDYIKVIRNTQGETWREWAYWVKVADMKDHLMQRETLTDHLKEKYWESIPYLL